MPKIICVDCEVEYKPDKNGVYLIEMAWQPPQPYKIWHSDMWICPSCLHQVIAGFGHQALAEHYQDDFQPLLNSIRDSSAVIVHCYERVGEEKWEYDPPTPEPRHTEPID